MSARHKIVRSGFETAFERKVSLAVGAAFRAVLAARLAGARTGGTVRRALAGGPLAPLPELPHKIVLGLFGLGLRRRPQCAPDAVRWPSRERSHPPGRGDVRHRHRPASSYEDTLTLGAEDARTAAFGGPSPTAGRSAAKLRVGRPSPRTDRYDPFALRALAAARRIRDADRGRRQRVGPAVVGLPFRRARQGSRSAPRRLGDAAVLHRQAADHARRRRLSLVPARRTKPAGPMEVPDQSMLVVRASGPACVV